MDYLTELASHPDVAHAVEAVGGPVAAKLKAVEYLRDDYPQVWTNEILYQLRHAPAVAAEVWTQLRYGPSELRSLAASALAQESQRLPFQGTPLPEWPTYREQYATEPRAATELFATQLAADQSRVDSLTSTVAGKPWTPELLKDILGAEGITTPRWDDNVRDLLQNPATVRERAAAKGVPVSWRIMVDAELEQIQNTRDRVRRRNRGNSPPEGATFSICEHLVGLAFSGGGIRSATFNLGVLQALAGIGLLKECDYLSTVSGGGYIGSWFSAWTHREAGSDPKASIERMERLLAPPRHPDPTDNQVRPIRFLREYSNYLTPKTGFLSADTWTMLGIYTRNTLLNQVIIVTLCASLLLLPRAWYVVPTAIASALDWRLPFGVSAQWLVGLLWLPGFVFLLLNLRRLSKHKGSVNPVETAPPRYAQPRAIHLGVVLPALLAAALTTATFAQEVAVVNGVWVADAPALSAAAAWWGIATAAAAALLLSFGRVHVCWPRARERVIAIGLAAVGAGTVAWGLSYLFLTVPSWETLGPNEIRWHVIALFPPALLTVMSLAIVVQLGMLGETFPDEHREWWSRMRTCMHMWTLGWLALFGVSLYAPWALASLPGANGSGNVGMAILAWAASTFFGVRQGQTAEDERKRGQESDKAGSVMVAASRRYFALVAPYVFAIGLFLGVAIAIHAVFDHFYAPVLPAGGDGYWRLATWSADSMNGWPRPLVAALALGGIGLLFSWRVDINEFSIHHFYKNRLVRGYMGASRTAERQPDWFTGFDPNDDLPLKTFDDAKDTPHPYPGPYPIINCALNLVGGRDLAWQERKAASFVFTPKYLRLRR